MKLRHQAPDWPSMIDDLEGKGLSYADMSTRLGFAASERVIAHYRNGVQPLYHRGEPLIDLWCAVMVKTRTDVPRIPVVKPYRVPYALRKKEVVVPVWPVPQPAPIKRGRPKKVPA